MPAIPSLPYIYQNDLNFPIPVVANEVVMTMFVVKGDHARLQALCDRYLNNLPGTQYRFAPLGSHLLLTFSGLKAIATTPPYDEYGWCREHGEVTFWMPTIQYKRELGVWVPQRFAFFIPYIFLDNTVPLTVGRDSYGMPKQFGWIDWPTVHDAPQHYTLDAYALKTYSQETEVKRERVLSVIGPDQQTRADEVWTNPRQGFGAVKAIALPEAAPQMSNLPAKFFSDLHFNVPIVCFKQFRDSENGNNACYQAIVDLRSEVRVESFRGGLLHGDYTLSVETLQSHPIVNDLGLNVGKVPLALWLNFSMTMTNGKAIWSGSNAAESGQPRLRKNLWERLWWAFFPGNEA
ncbi:MAG: hypothetical protein SF029_16775 [bacterium]|nr:hypothetical protein [bacterium]